jgi:hypothetical protein
MVRGGQLIAEAMTERELLDNILSMARYLGWLGYHTHDSRHSAPGFPDIFLVRGQRVLAIECKRQDGRTTPDQDAWLSALREAGIDAYVIRPNHWLSGYIEEVLR